MSLSLQAVHGASPAICIALIVVWLLTRVAMGRISVSHWRWILAPFSLLASWGFWWSALITLDSFIETAGTWPHGILAFLAAVTGDLALTLYVDQRGSTSKLVHWFPIGLRLLLVALLTIILMEPIVSHHEEESSQRQVAVLVDASASMSLSDRGTKADEMNGPRHRSDEARRLLLDKSAGTRSILDQLESDYCVRLYEFANTPREVKLDDWRSHTIFRNQEFASETLTPAVLASDWARTTDTASAINRVKDELPLDELSGLILLTDGCDHSRSDLEDATRALVRRQIPIHTILIGNQNPIRDAEVTSVQAPRQVFLGDSITIRAPIKVDRLSGQNVKARLIRDDETIAEKTIEVRTNRHRETFVFQDQPEHVGVHEYSVEIAPVPGESIQENNRLSSRVWVSKDSIRMLIVENRPRWEFRYLRNLFAGRDRSVQLQYVLLHPDRLAGVPEPPTMHASVNRSFDDCEATALPESAEEWLKFDVIVLGDVAPDDLGTDVIQTLEKFVARRGGTLIAVSGRHYMPHAFEHTPLAEALPVDLEGSREGDAVSPEASYFFKIATGAESHVIVQQSTNPLENEAVWQALPQLHWRHPASKAKTGATVLAYAGLARDAVASQQEQHDRALILWHRFGAGKVVQLAFDQTWRLRYGVGDRHHHRFWGQMLRWSVQDRLAAGTELVRMGTDRMLYRVGDRVKVRARLLDENRNAVSSEDTQASVFLDDELVQRANLTSESEASGMLSATIDGLTRPGKYRIELSGQTVDQLLSTEGRTGEVISVDFALEGTDPATELSDLVADSTVPLKLADWTGGIVARPNEAARVLEQLGPKSTFRREQWVEPLWNRWPVIVSFLLIVGLEWVLRKSSGLI